MMKLIDKLVALYKKIKSNVMSLYTKIIFF